MQLLESKSDAIKLAGDFPEFSAEELFEYWTTPDLLVKFWPNTAVLDPKVGGEYKFTWPAQNWTLFGTYLSFNPGVELGFTWQWNFSESGFPTAKVLMTFEPKEVGCRLQIQHSGLVTDEEKGSLTEGWIHFSMRLRGLKSETEEEAAADEF